MQNRPVAGLEGPLKAPMGAEQGQHSGRGGYPPRIASNAVERCKPLKFNARLACRGGAGPEGRGGARGAGRGPETEKSGSLSEPAQFEPFNFVSFAFPA